MNMKHRGFTVLEILIAISIMVLTITIVTFSFSKLNSSQTLDKSADLVVSILNEARSLTLSSVNDSQYGVSFEDSQVILFKGSIYLLSDPSNVVTELNSLVGLRNIILNGGGTSVIFKRLTGNTFETGTVEIFLKASTTTFRTITISATGIVELD
ncbi:MAG: prepilin-type N-terminal cleavage/methylation domain-containing protein [bacterium]|nr:prepilin-type N-terminal cleavage/methylation domain-containing protein [bacterium]